MKRARFCLLILICCAAHGCTELKSGFAEFKKGVAEGQTDELVRQARDASDRAVRFAEYADSKFEDAQKKFTSDREEARRFAAGASELYEQSAASFDKAAKFSEVASGLDLDEPIKEYYRVKAEEFRVRAEMLRVLRGHVEAFSASERIGKPSESVQAFEEKMDELMAKKQRLQERAKQIGAENNMAAPDK